MDDEAEDVVASITYHFAVGNAELSSEQFGQHLEAGSCPACADGVDFSALLRQEELTV